MLKRILVGLLAVLVGLSFFVTLYTADVDESRVMRETTNGIGVCFEVPVHPELNDPDIVLYALVNCATKNHVNIFRTSVGYDANDKPFTTHYVLLASEQTVFFNEFRLRDGRFLTPNDTQKTTLFVSTKETESTEQVGLIEDINRNDSVSIYGLHEAYQSLPAAGRYWVESNRPEDTDAFFKDFVDELNAIGANVSRQSLILESSITIRSFADNSRLINWSLIWVVIVAVIILVAYRQLYESKRTAVLLLQGNSAFQAWFVVSGRVIVTTMVILSIASLAISLVIPGTTMSLIRSNALTMAAVTLLTLTASLITVPYISNIKTSDALKNRKDTSTILVYNIIMKCGLSVVLITTTISGLALLGEINEATAKLGSWQSTSQYGIFYPRSIGNDVEELASGQIASTAAEIYDLYPALNDRGALYVYAGMYEPIALQQGLPAGYFRSMQVNPNYLSEYPIVDKDGNSVTVSEEEIDWVLLVPMKYRTNEDQILQFFRLQRFGNAEMESRADFEKRIFNRDVPEAIQNQSIRIIWIKDNQRVFTFNPLVAPEDGNCIVDPIVEVMTIHNSMAFDRINGINGMPGTGIKVKLINGDTTATLNELRGLLKELHLDDNLLHLVTLNDYALFRLQELQQEFQTEFVGVLLVFVLFIVLAIQTVTLLFEQNARSATVRKLLGYPFFIRHRYFFLTLSVTWSVMYIVSLLLSSILLPMIGVPVANTPLILFVVLVAFIIEVAISAAALYLVESKRIPDVIKGEF